MPFVAQAPLNSQINSALFNYALSPRVDRLHLHYRALIIIISCFDAIHIITNNEEEGTLLPSAPPHCQLSGHRFPQKALSGFNCHRPVSPSHVHQLSSRSTLGNLTANTSPADPHLPGNVQDLPLKTPLPPILPANLWVTMHGSVSRVTAPRARNTDCSPHYSSLLLLA